MLHTVVISEPLKINGEIFIKGCSSTLLIIGSISSGFITGFD